MFSKSKKVFSAFSIILISACGGGGDSSEQVVSTKLFNYQSAYIQQTKQGYSKTFSLSGTCTGTVEITVQPVINPKIFDNTPALFGNILFYTKFIDCAPASSGDMKTQFTDNNYIPLGYSILGGEYAVYISQPILPTNIKVGDTGVLGTLNRYTNSTKQNFTGTMQKSYVVEPDTETTAIMNFISKTYDTSNFLVSTTQDRYRIDDQMMLTPISFDSVNHLNKTHIVGN